MGNARFVGHPDHDACGVGFVAQLGSLGSRDVIERALTALIRLTHRGGVDADGSSGDGAGLLLPIPKEFFRARAREERIDLPVEFGLGMAFFPPGREKEARAEVEKISALSGLRCCGWRKVPLDASILGPSAAATLPAILQVFFASNKSGDAFERQLFFLRKRIEAEGRFGIYFCSLSSRSVVYKGLLAPWQVAEFYPDIAHPRFQASFAVFHQRYSTNTRPTWSLAQPFRFLAHNGEINTINANRRWMRTREKSILWEMDAPQCCRLLESGVSDSASFDNALEVHLHREYSLAAAMLRLVPPAWVADPDVTPALKLFLQTQAGEQEPWDGPAAIVFSDGRYVGAKLDRNGLRPLRYTVTSDGLVIAGSEVGLSDFDDKQIHERMRLGPGEMIVVDPVEGLVLRGNDVAKMLAVGYGRENWRPARKIEPSADFSGPATEKPRRIAAALGWSDDQYRMLFQSLGMEGKEAIWSMGDDAPPAFISSAGRPLWDYCKQRFAQVTNPPIDPLREAHVMSLDVHLGKTLFIESPLLDFCQIEKICSHIDGSVRAFDFTFESSAGVEGALAASDRLRAAVRAAASEPTRPKLIILSDRKTSAERAALPAMLAVAAVWKALVNSDAFDIALVVETGQVVETHHLAMLIAVGATAVLPYLALEMSEQLKLGGAARYRAGVEAGLRKVIARMGISTIASYRNSHLFETVGLDGDIVDAFFEDASAVLGRKNLGDILRDSLDRHIEAFKTNSPEMRDEGLYRFRQTGEQHASSPDLVRRMHKYIQSPTPEGYRAFAELAETREPVATRDLIELCPGASPISLDEVEPDTAILSRFSTQAMSLGALGPEAVRTLAIAMNRLGGRSNTGEGGEDSDIYRFEPEARNKVKQVASARFGVTAEYLVRAEELEIKMAQGSKPGEGGQLPAAKVTPFIARIRHAVPGMSLISPPPHHDIYSIEDLAQLIYDLRAVNPSARIGVKLVSGAGVGIIAAGVAKAGADVITVSGFDGGTGASPLTSIKNTGLPWELGLREAHKALVLTGFRGRVRLRADGGLKFGRDVIIAALLGADEFGFGTAALLSIGCVMARQCHLNTCPAGIATQNEKYRARFTGKPEMAMAYFRGVAAEVRERLSRLGIRSLDEIIGEAHMLRARTEQAGETFAELLAPIVSSTKQSKGMRVDDQGIHRELSRAMEHDDAKSGKPLKFFIANSDRSVGAHLSGQILRRTGYLGLRSETIQFEFHGTAGQSFGAFLIRGISFRLTGEANDYVGKSLSGGTIAITAGPDASQRGDVLAGNTVLYGATSGELYIAGRAGERFAVRNSGALAVVEGVGQHGCEYMTAGIVILLGRAGINLGSGMTGGLVYALGKSLAATDYNSEFVRRAEIEAPERIWLRRALMEHLRLTDSPKARRLLRPSSPSFGLVRLEPVSRPCSVEQTWEPILSRWQKQDSLTIAVPIARRAADTRSADPVHDGRKGRVGTVGNRFCIR
jgi:glutamate synthase domain-containing protein 2/glutamate synthase domain-containing protein 1/formylmethanofuran dehydrogenase subunit C